MTTSSLLPIPNLIEKFIESQPPATSKLLSDREDGTYWDLLVDNAPEDVDLGDTDWEIFSVDAKDKKIFTPEVLKEFQSAVNAAKELDKHFEKFQQLLAANVVKSDPFKRAMKFLKKEEEKKSRKRKLEEELEEKLQEVEDDDDDDEDEDD